MSAEQARRNVGVERLVGQEGIVAVNPEGISTLRQATPRPTMIVLHGGSAVDEQIAAAVRADVPHGHRREGLTLWRPVVHDRAQSSSARRITAGAFGFFDLTQSAVRPDR